jgi:hypothetical protein
MDCGGPLSAKCPFLDTDRTCRVILATIGIVRDDALGGKAVEPQTSVCPQ